MYDLTGFQRDILYVIAGLEEPHGLAVKDELDTDERVHGHATGLREIEARREWESQYLEDVKVPTTS